MIETEIEIEETEIETGTGGDRLVLLHRTMTDVGAVGVAIEADHVMIGEIDYHLPPLLVRGKEVEAESEIWDELEDDKDCCIYVFFSAAWVFWCVLGGWGGEELHVF